MVLPFRKIVPAAQTTRERLLFMFVVFVSCCLVLRSLPPTAYHLGEFGQLVEPAAVFLHFFFFHLLAAS